MTVTDNPNRNGADTMRGDDSETLVKIVEQSRNRSAVYDVLTNGVPVTVSVDVG